MRRVAFACVVACVLACLGFSRPADAGVVIHIDKSKQRMSVAVDGAGAYSWPVSTGLAGGPPSGFYRPVRLERKWYSRKFNWSPMPHAIFFRDGYAIHGTYYVSRLGHRASHGCVRLLPANAATLFALVRNEGVGNTQIVISNGPAMRAMPHGMRASFAD